MYKTLVLPVLNYASPVWSPHYAYEVNKLESVQHTFLRHIAWRFGSPMDWRDHDYSRVMSQFRMPTLESIRLTNDARLAFNIINRNIDCPELSNLFVSREIPYNLRQARTFSENRYRSDLAYYSTIPRLIRLWHSLPPNISQQYRPSIFKKLSNSHLYKFS